MTPNKPGFFERALRFSFLVASAAGFFRVYGAIIYRAEILEFSRRAWLPAFLIAAGGLMGLFSLCVWLLLKFKPKPPAWLPWAGVIVNIAAYWSERLFLWAPSQRNVNTLWMIGVHLVWLLLAAASCLQTKRRLNEHD